MIQILFSLMAVGSLQNVLAKEAPPLFQILTEMHRQAKPVDFQRPPTQSNLTPSEIHRRAQAVLDHFGVPSTDTLPDHFFESIRSPSPQNDNLRYLQITPNWSRFSTLTSQQHGLNTLTVYQDRDAFQTLDFATTFPITTPTGNAPKGLPLQGLKIALDPGHMGGALWDQRTGKFIRGKNGKVLSEGILNLQIALLLEEKLTRQGAQVLLTHRDTVPVSEVPYENIDMNHYALEQLRESTLNEWFLDLLNTAPPSPQLYQAFQNSPAFQKIFSPSMRGYFFVRKADLEARVQKIRDFDPDLTLIIHLDVGGAHLTKAYIPGAFFTEEFATQELRSNFAWHYLNKKTWENSRLLSRSIVQSIEKNMGIKRQPSHGDNAIFIEPGIFSRNMPLTRKPRGAISFLECLFYDHPSEFEALSREVHPLMIGDKNYPYSDRLMDLVNAIEAGVLDYFPQAQI